MRTNIVLDDDLINEAMRLAHVKTKREAVDLALRRFVSSQKQRRILELVGQELIDPAYDYKAARAGDGSSLILPPGLACCATPTGQQSRRSSGFWTRKQPSW